MSASKAVVLITGGNGGIGYLTAASLATSSPEKYHVIIGSRDISKGATALSSLQSSNPKGSFSMVQLDVTDQKSITAAAEHVSKEFGHLDVLVNNAGIITHATTLIDQLRDTFETNTFGPAIVTETFTPLLGKSSNARLIYVSSSLGSITERGDAGDKYYQVPASVYRMSKAALNMLAMCHHVELGPKGVKVWAFDPGYVVTNLSGTGEKGRQERVDRGAGDARESAGAINLLIEGKRDGDAGKFVGVTGLHPW